MTLSASIVARLSGGFTLDVSLSVPAGITIVFGASGSGKTTLFRCLAGLVRPDSGRITVGDRTLFDSATGTDVSPQQRRSGFVFQQLALFPHMSVADNLEYGLATLPASERRERTRTIASSFRLSHLLSRRPTAISGGERQRAALARSLVTDPAFLLLDEPLSALDLHTQSHIVDDLRVWNAAHRIPVLYVTHAHREVFALGERVIVLEGGRVIAEGTPHDVLEMPSQESLAQLAGFENFFDATVLERRVDQGTMRCRLQAAGTELEVPLANAEVNARVRLAVRAGDILLATEEPRGLSARNVLPGTLVSLRREGATVITNVDAGARFIVHLTPGAAEALALAPARPVWVIVKTHSCRVVSQ